MIIHAIHFESRITGITPEDSRHAQLMCFFEGFCYLLQLAVAFRTAPVDRRANRNGAHIPGVFYLSEKSLVIAVGEAEEFIMIDLYDEGDAVRVFAAHDPQYAEGGCDGIAS